MTLHRQRCSQLTLSLIMALILGFAIGIYTCWEVRPYKAIYFGWVRPYKAIRNLDWAVFPTTTKTRQGGELDTELLLVSLKIAKNYGSSTDFYNLNCI